MIEVLSRSWTAFSRPTAGRRPRRALALMAAFAWLGLGIGAAQAVQSVRVPAEADAIDLTTAVEHYGAQGDRIQVSTAPGADGIVRRIEVSALEAGAQPAWIVFALTNDSDEQLTRLVVAPHFRFVGSGVVWPDLGSSRITAITASQGSPPEREDRLDADVFRVTLDPGATVTYVAELRTPSLPQLYLWEPDAFKDKGASLTLYQGILIGVAGLLALFLTIVFVVRGALVFPAAAALAWAVFAYVCIDFGFWRKIFGFEDEAERVWRAGVEATIGATLIIFLFAYLNLRRWHVRFLHIGMVWLLLMAAVVGLSIYNAPVAAGVARISIATVAAIGFLLILSMAARGSERAVMLIPTWFLLVVWVLAAGAAALGGLTNDIAAPGLIGGLVLIVMLIGFTIMQSAFAAVGAAGPGGADAERRALAMTGCGDAIFDWNVVADQIYVSAEIEGQLGLKRGSLEGPAAAWLDILHPLDRDRYSAALEGVLQQRSGRISHDIRLRGADSRYHSFTLKARPVVNAAGEVVRVIGALSDVTEIKTAEERILHDAIHDNLTGLPNRELFLDRLGAAIVQAERSGAPTPAALAIDVDRFKEVNDALGMAFGDSALLAVARRLGRELKPGDTLARIGGDQFGVIVMFDDIEAELERFVASLKGMMASPISFGDREVALTVSIGVVAFDPVLHKKGADLLADAEVALANAKKAGGDCCRDLRRADAGDALGPPVARPRSAPRARPRPDQRDVPADRAARGPHRRRFRGAAALASSAIGPAGAGRFLFARRRQRRVGRDRRLRHRDDGARTRRLAEGARGHAADLRQHQRFGAPVARPRSAQRRAHRAQPPLRAARHAEARTRRGAGDGEPRICAAAAAPRARARRRPGARRFRRRLHLAQPPPALSFRHAQGRSVAGEAQRRRRAAGDPALGDRHGA